ncbi:LacI family DNA-binding transcriptional regulator [Caproicibacter sp. BJN0012]|uniref:LacI family DNA-binding transcriptional regulator n=1 Tax=Caproicibacter sp. BJN0012 TaxID=3110227 RepID=UPI002E0E6247
MSITIKQIADLANVSRATVDKVIHSRPGVKEKTKLKVLKIIKEVNYQPNIIGKALVSSKKAKKFGVILTPEYNPFVHELLQGIQKANDDFSPFGVEIETKMLTTLEPAEQISILNDFSYRGFTGIAVFPLNDTQVIMRINQIIQSGIAVVTFNSRVDGINDLCFVGQNHYKGGRTAAELLNKLVPPKSKVCVIISSKKLSCHTERLQGFRDKLAECSSSLQIVDIQENQDRKEDAFKIALNNYNKYPDLAGIYISGGGVDGIGSALEFVGAAKKIKVVCHDLTPDSCKLLKSGAVDFVLDQNPYEQGYQILKILFDDLIMNLQPESHFFEIPITITSEELIPSNWPDAG